MTHLYFKGERLVLVLCGPSGDDGIYRYWLELERGWEFCAPQSSAWDYYHQMVYRMRDLVAINELPDGVPPLPQEFPPPVEIHVLDKEHETESTRVSGPVSDAIRQAGGSRRVYVLLTEDRYESLFGDGIFRNFETAFFDRAEAVAAARKIDPTFGTDEGAGTETPRAHLREVVLTLEDDEVRIDKSRSERTVFDHYDRAKICDALAERLSH